MATPKSKRARELRHEAGDAERLIWRLLCDRQLAGCKFRRQHPIGPYFADFACVSRRLVVEIDGEHHAFQTEADAYRTELMKRWGWRGPVLGERSRQQYRRRMDRDSDPPCVFGM
jgi:very-short-patch-repair endonuclease